jgi:hypothetical protein
MAGYSGYNLCPVAEMVELVSVLTGNEMALQSILPFTLKRLGRS